MSYDNDVSVNQTSNSLVRKHIYLTKIHILLYALFVIFFCFYYLQILVFRGSYNFIEIAVISSLTGFFRTSTMFRQLKSLSATYNLVRKMPNVAHMSSTSEPVDPPYVYTEIPCYDFDKPQSLEKRKARLLYQSRKRGMLENDLLLSTFAAKYLDGFNEKQTIMYDRIINSLSNEWDLFYWMVQKAPTPPEYDNEIMDLLKKHAKNEERISLRVPDLY